MTLLAVGQIRRIFFQAFYVNGNIIMLAMLSLKNKLKKYNLRRHELLLHPLTLHSVDFLTLPVLRQHVVLQSWRLLTSMQRLSNLHSGHTAAFHNPTSAFPCLCCLTLHRDLQGQGKGLGAPGNRRSSQESLLEEIVAAGAALA